jgi:hypothetical protein
MGDRKPRGELAELQVSLQSLIEKGKRSDKEMRALKKDVFKKARAGRPPSAGPPAARSRPAAAQRLSRRRRRSVRRPNQNAPPGPS